MEISHQIKRLEEAIENKRALSWNDLNWILSSLKEYKKIKEKPL